LTRRQLSAEARRRALTLAIPEGALFAAMVGLAEAWFVVDAIRLGATPIEQAIVVGLPLFAGALGALTVVRCLTLRISRKALTVGCVLGQAAALLSVALLDVMDLQTPARLMLGASLYFAFGQGSAPAWVSWYGDVVPSQIRGAYFARRTRAVQYSTCAATVLAGLLLQAFEPRLAFGLRTEGFWPALEAPGRGFFLIFLLAALFRASSAVLLCLSAAPEGSAMAGRTRVLQFLRTSRGSNAWRIVTGAAGFQFTVFVSSPFFVPFMAEELGFSYFWLMVALATQIGLKGVFQGRVGGAIDRHGPRAIWLLAAILCALIPLPFLWADGLGWTMAAQVLSGIAWGSFEVALFVLLIDTTFKATRPHAVAAQSALTGAGQFGGSLVGGAFLALTDRSFRWLFALSVLLRLAMALTLPRLVHPRRGGRESAPGDVLLRALHLRR
jgi:MFS family permease